MPTERHDKLVRDRIPEIVTASGARPETRVADPVEYRALLRAKLVEEMHEFLEEENPAELVDILEVVRALAIDLSTDPEELERLREKKATENGTFAERIVLCAVHR
ncbi:nucleoside triphosphate pyrophosphohydrolase [Actinocatenispora rupis]|uniref:Phosphoribosyl-ATP pyrophosphohydrolase n=1 Tax=Actinocatenispora rupis TaxID=519421 RepID=A0A8J3JCH6_9ACTN|nr:nucleoside triphosphate pyrophosphohydrolase [Actinocatenispora rupis]GID13468.1 phosphoribosyl-ATP pyrophosphohydrolase [Actinocatenispora rupis]